MPKYLKDAEASRLRAEGKAKHLPDESRRIPDPGPDPHEELHRATAEVLARLADGQAELAGEIAAGRRSHEKLMEKVIAAGKPLPPAAAPKPEPRIRRWEFSVEHDDEGRIKRVVAQA